MSPFNVYRILQKLAKRAGIEKKVWTYLFRHSKGALIARQSINEDARMRLMGHRTSVMQWVDMHMGLSDAENIILERSGIKKPEKEFSNPLATISCPNCRIDNLATAKFCTYS